MRPAAAVCCENVWTQNSDLLTPPRQVALTNGDLLGFNSSNKISRE
jgi:hypothetical protein